MLQTIPADLDVEVYAEGVWRYGILREWRQEDDRSWLGWVRWNRGPAENLCGLFPAEHIRPLPSQPDDASDRRAAASDAGQSSRGSLSSRA